MASLRVLSTFGHATFLIPVQFYVRAYAEGFLREALQKKVARKALYGLNFGL